MAQYVRVLSLKHIIFSPQSEKYAKGYTRNAALPRDIYHLDRIIAVSTYIIYFLRSARSARLSMHIYIYIYFSFRSPERKLQRILNLNFSE